jgi:signal transduction histidine kinase
MFSQWKRLAQGLKRARHGTHHTDRIGHRQSVEMLGRFAHEARQPLSAARAAFELFRHASDGAGRDRAYLVMDRQLIRLARLFDDLVETNGLAFGKTVLRIEQIDLRHLVEEVVESIRPQTAAKQQELSTHLPGEAVWVSGDAARLEQVVSNLLSNGIKYTGSRGRVGVDLAEGQGRAVLTVSDTGLGIDSDLLPHIFEPFFRGDDTSGDGLGVGLAIARQLVELHGGTIHALSSGSGHGSTFVVTLPMRSFTHAA